jgi:hypothetical protein
MLIVTAVDCPPAQLVFTRTGFALHFALRFPRAMAVETVSMEHFGIFFRKRKRNCVAFQGLNVDKLLGARVWALHMGQWDPCAALQHSTYVYSVG